MESKLLTDSSFSKFFPAALLFTATPHHHCRCCSSHHRRRRLRSTPPNSPRSRAHAPPFAAIHTTTLIPLRCCDPLLRCRSPLHPSRRAAIFPLRRRGLRVFPPSLPPPSRFLSSLPDAAPPSSPHRDSGVHKDSRQLSLTSPCLP